MGESKKKEEELDFAVKMLMIGFFEDEEELKTERVFAMFEPHTGRDRKTPF